MSHINGGPTFGARERSGSNTTITIRSETIEEVEIRFDIPFQRDPNNCQHTQTSCHIFGCNIQRKLVHFEGNLELPSDSTLEDYIDITFPGIRKVTIEYSIWEEMSFYNTIRDLARTFPTSRVFWNAGCQIGFHVTSCFDDERSCFGPFDTALDMLIQYGFDEGY